MNMLNLEPERSVGESIERPEEAEYPRNWGIALVFSMLTPGLGQMYNGQALRGVGLAVLALLVNPLIWVAALEVQNETLRILLSVCGVVLFPCMIWGDALLQARRLRSAYTLRWYNRWYCYLAVLGLAAFGIYPVYTSVVHAHGIQTFKIPSEAMKNTLLVGDHALARMGLDEKNPPQRGEIVVFRFPGDESVLYVKRVIALPGETIEIRGRQVLIDGKALLEPYTIYRTFFPRQDFAAITLPPQHYFLMGDNRDNSADSRFFGAVHIEKILGRFRLLYFSWDQEAYRVRWERMGKHFSIRSQFLEQEN